MKTIPQDSFTQQVSGKGVNLRDRGHVPVEGGVETGNLFHTWLRILERLDGIDLVRQVIGSEGDQIIQCLYEIRGE